MKNKNYFVWILLLLTTFACSLMTPPTTQVPASAGVTEVVSQPQAAVTFTPIPTFTAAAPSPQSSETLSLNAEPFSEKGDAPPYTFTAQIPYLQGSDDVRVTNFNALLKQLAEKEINTFRDSILTIAPLDPINAGSSFDLQYTLVGQKQDYWGIKYDISLYFDGSAHPSHYSLTINYNLDQGREIPLDELFTPSSNYLQVISDFCKAELSARDIGFDGFAVGADPLPENYTRWNISKEGLVITFDEYQVAPYAAGPQVVVIPASALQSIINPDRSLLFSGQ